MTQPTQEVLLRKFALDKALVMPRYHGNSSVDAILADAEKIYAFCAKSLPAPKAPPTPRNSDDLPF